MILLSINLFILNVQFWFMVIIVDGNGRKKTPYAARHDIEKSSSAQSMCKKASTQVKC